MIGMTLTCDRLIKFDLVETVEKNADVDLAVKLFSLKTEIEKIDNFIKESPSFPGSTDKIMRGEMVSVIGATLSIEGTVLEKEEIEQSLKKAELGESLQRKEQEAENSRQVYAFIRDFVERNRDTGFEYSESLIRQIHSYFTASMNYLSNVPGQYRSNFVATFGVPRKESLCRTQSEIEEAMKNFIVWLNQKQTGMLSHQIFIKAIMAHYYLSEIHPFGDGNGRTARALEALILNAHGINDYCFWSLANFWSNHRDQYLYHLHNIRITLDPVNFILWGLEGYREEITRIKEMVRKKVRQLMLLDYVQYLLRNKRRENIKINHRIVHLVELLVRIGRVPMRKFMDSPEVRGLYGSCSQSTKTRDFNKMITNQLIYIEQVEQEFFIEPNFKILDYITYNV
jgi:Fic family protein